MLIIYQIVLPVSIQTTDDTSLKFSPQSSLLEEGEFLPFTDLERFLISKWKRDSHFLPHHSPEAAALVGELSHVNHPRICGDESPSPDMGQGMDLSLTLCMATCSAISASSRNSPGILKAAKQLLFQMQCRHRTCNCGSIFRMFDDDSALQIVSLGRELLHLPSFGLSTADCATTALQLAMYSENFPLFCSVISNLIKLPAVDGESIVRAVCDSGASLFSEVSVPLCCNFTDLSQGPSFSLPFIGESVSDCVVAFLSGEMHCLISVVRDGHGVIIDYLLPGTLSSADCITQDSDAQPLPAANFSLPPLKGVVVASGIDAILEQGNSPFARTGFSDQLVRMIAEGVSSEQLSSHLTEYLGDENLVVSLVQFVQVSVRMPSVPECAWKRNSSGCFGTHVAAVFDGPPTIINYMGAILIVDSKCVRRFDGKCLASVPDFTWIDESQRKLASTLHHGSHCVVGHIIFVSSAIPDESCTLIQAYDPSAHWKSVSSLRVNVPYYPGLAYFLGNLLIQQTNDGSSFTFVAVPLVTLTSTKSQEILAQNAVFKHSIICQTVPSGRIRYSDNKYLFYFHNQTLQDSHKSCSVSFLVDACLHNQSSFDWLPPINDRFYQLSDFVSRATRFQGNTSHDGVCSYSGWSLSRLRHPDIKDSTVILDRPITSINRERYFEVVIRKSSTEDGVSLGLCHSGYEQLRSHPGWFASSVGYHGDDGGFYVGDPVRKQHSSSMYVKQGDVAGCGILDHDLVFFTQNGVLVGFFHIAGSSTMHPAIGGRKDDSGDRGNECLVRLAPPFSFQPANTWPHFSRAQSIVERSWPTSPPSPFSITVDSSTLELCSSFLANISLSAQTEFELSRTGACRSALVFTYNRVHWKYVSSALIAAPNPNQSGPPIGGRADRRSRPSRRSARNEAAEGIIDPAVPDIVQSPVNVLPAVLEIHVQDCSQVELFVCPYSVIGSVTFKLSQDVLGNIPFGNPNGYASSGPIPGLRGFPSVVIPCNHFYVHFTEPKDGGFYSFSIIALPLMVAGCVRVSNIENLLDFISLFGSDSNSRISGHSKVFWDSAISILRIQAWRGWLQFLITNEVPNSRAIQSLIEILMMVLDTGSVHAQFAAAGVFLHCFSVQSFVCSLGASQIADVIIQISHLGMEVDYADSSFLESGYFSLAQNFSLWNQLFQNGSNSTLEKLVSSLMSLSVWHKRFEIPSTRFHAFEAVCVTLSSIISSRSGVSMSLRQHFVSFLCDAAQTWSTIKDKLMISESFISCVAIPFFRLFDVESIDQVISTTSVLLITKISCVIRSLQSDILYRSLCASLTALLDLGVSMIIRSAEYCFLSSQLSKTETHSLSALMRSRLFSTGFICPDDRDVAGEMKRAILQNDDSIQHIFQLLNGTTEFKTDFSKIEHRTSAFLFLSASNMFPFFQGYEEQSTKSRESFLTRLQNLWQEYLSCTKDCWSDSAATKKAMICLDLKSLNSWNSAYPVDYSASISSNGNFEIDNDGLLSQLLDFIKSDLLPSAVVDSVNAWRKMAALRLQGLLILQSLVESLDSMHNFGEYLTCISSALRKFMSNHETSSNVLGNFHFHPDLIDAHSKFMIYFTKMCIKCSAPQLSRACIMYMTKLHPSDEKWITSDAFKLFLQHLITSNSSSGTVKPYQPCRPGINLPHSFSAAYLPSGHWICHGGLECVDSALSLSSKFWMREPSGAWHLLECFGEVPHTELGLVGHTLTTLPNGFIAIVGGYSCPPIQSIQKVYFASVDVGKKLVHVSCTVLNVSAIQPMDHSCIFYPSDSSLIVVGGWSTKFKPLSQCLMLSVDLSNSHCASAASKLLPEPDRSLVSSPLGRKPALCFSQTDSSKLFLFHGDCDAPSILELDLCVPSSDAWRKCCNVESAGIGRSLFIDNQGSWILYGGYNTKEDRLDTIRVSSSNNSVSRVETSGPIFMRHFVSNSCISGCSHQDFFQVLDGGCSTKCQQTWDPRIFEFNPNYELKSLAHENEANSGSNIGTLLKVLAVQSVSRDFTVPRSWFSSIWNHYAHLFAKNSTHLANAVSPPPFSGTVLRANYFNLEHWNGTIASESGHVTLGSWCWVSPSRLTKPITLLILARNSSNCCSVRLCESRHLEVIATTSSNMATVLLRTDHPVPSARWFHFCLAVKCCAAFQCKLFIGSHPIGPWTIPKSLLIGSSRPSDNGFFFENVSFAAHIPQCDIVDTDSITLYDLMAVDSVCYHRFSEWSMRCPPAWHESQTFMNQCKEIVSVLRSSISVSPGVVLEIPGFLSSIILSLLRGPLQVSSCCALFLSESSGLFSVDDLDSAISECNIGEASFVSAVLSRVRYLVHVCLSHATALLNILHLMFRNNTDTRKIIFRSILPLIQTVTLPVSDDVCSDICISLAIVSGNFHADVPGALILSNSCNGYLKTKVVDDVHVLHLDHDEYVISSQSSSSIVRDCLESDVEEEIYVAVCKFCHYITSLCIDFRRNTGVDVSLEIICNNVIRTFCSLNPVGVHPSTVQAMNALLMSNFLLFSQYLNGVQDFSAHVDNFALFDHVKKLKCIGLQPMNPRAITNRIVLPHSPLPLFEPLLGYCCLDTKREPGRTFQFHAHSSNAFSIIAGFVPDHAMKELIEETSCDFSAFPFCSTVTMTRASFPNASSSRDIKISTELCSSGVTWASFQIDLNHFVLGLTIPGRQTDVRGNGDNCPRFIGAEVPAEAIGGSRLPALTSADICTLVLDFNTHSLSFYQNNELSLSLPIGSGPYHFMYQGFVVSSCIKAIDSDSEIVQSVLKRHGKSVLPSYTVGTRVTLSPSYFENSDSTKRGPLNPGDIGIVKNHLEHNEYLVQASDGQEHLYPGQALIKNHLSDSFVTVFDVPSPSLADSSHCVINASWCAASAFTFEAEVDGRKITLPPPHAPSSKSNSDVWWPFVICKLGSPSISFLSKVSSHETVRMSACEVIFHRRLIRRKRYREHALALAKRLSNLTQGDTGKASQLVSDHRKFREVAEVEFWSLIHPSRRERAPWLKELFEFGVRTRVAWRACERQSDVQSAGVWATDEANANSLPADSQSEDDEPLSGASSAAFLPPTVPVPNCNFVAHFESLRGNRHNSFTSINSQRRDEEPAALKYEDPYAVIDDSSIESNTSKSSRPLVYGVLKGGNIDVELLGVCDNLMAVSASYSLRAILRTLHHVDMHDTRHLFSSVGSADLVSFLFNFISSKSTCIDVASQIGSLLDSLISTFGACEFERFLCAEIIKDSDSCARCLHIMNFAVSHRPMFCSLMFSSCISCFTDALLKFSSSHLRVHIFRLFCTCASQFEQSAGWFKILFRVLNDGYTYGRYFDHLDALPGMEIKVQPYSMTDQPDQHTSILSSHEAVKSFNAAPAVQSALFEFVMQVMLSPHGGELVSPIIYNSIPTSFFNAVWGMMCCKPLKFCSFIPEVSSILEAFEILSLSELVTLSASGSHADLPIFPGSSGVQISLPTVHGSFSVCWSDGRALKFLPSPGYSLPKADISRPVQVVKKSKSAPCRNWAADGSCRYGSKCRFDHSSHTDSAPLHTPMVSLPSSAISNHVLDAASTGGGAAVSHERRKSVAESIAAFESKLRARGGEAPSSAPTAASPSLRLEPLSAIVLEGQPTRIVFHHEAFGVSISPIYIPCFCSVQDLAFKDPSSDDITTSALGLCTRYGMFEQASKILDLITSSSRIPSVAEHSLAIASCHNDSVDEALRVLKAMESCGQTASYDIVQVLAERCTEAGKYGLAQELNSKCKGQDATNLFRIDTSGFSKHMWPLLIDCIAAKQFNLYFDAQPSSISNLLSQFVNFLPVAAVRPVVQQSISGSSQQGGRFVASLSRFKSSKAKCKGNSDDGNTVFAQLMEIVAQKGIRAFRSPLMEAPFEVKFKGEDGLDRIDRQGGGLFRECCSLLCSELQSAALPVLFKLPTESNSNSVFVFRSSLSATNRGHRLLQFFGSLLGMALRCGEPLNLDLDPSAWIAMLGLSQRAHFPSDGDRLHPLVKYRHERIEGLKQLMLAGEAAFDETVALGGDWEFCVKSLEGDLIDLVPQGRDKTVTFKSCKQLISLLESFIENEMTDCIRHVQQGLCRVVPLSSLLLLRWEQFEEMACGQREVSWEALRSCLRCGSGYNSMRDLPVQLLCETLSSFSSQERSMFLRFVSGRSRLPRDQSSSGSEQCIHIIKSEVPSQRSPDSYLPKAHTCFFQLELPAYSCAQVCRQRLLYAISNCQEVDGENQRALRAEDLVEFQ